MSINEATKANLRRKSGFIDEVQSKNGVPLFSWILFGFITRNGRESLVSRATAHLGELDGGLSHSRWFCRSGGLRRRYRTGEFRAQNMGVASRSESPRRSTKGTSFKFGTLAGLVSDQNWVGESLWGAPMPCTAGPSMGLI